MRRLLPLALLVPLAAGCGWFGHASGHTTATQALASTMVGQVPRWAKVEHLPKAALLGAKLFATAGCTTCHTYAGSGVKNLDAPDLTAIGSRHLGIRFQIRHLSCPSCVNPGSPMPHFDALGGKRLRELAIFLESSKGIR